MFSDSANGQTQYCPMCEEWAEKYEALKTRIDCINNISTICLDNHKVLYNRYYCRALRAIQSLCYLEDEEDNNANI